MPRDDKVGVKDVIDSLSPLGIRGLLGDIYDNQRRKDVPIPEELRSIRRLWEGDKKPGVSVEEDVRTTMQGAYDYFHDHGIDLPTLRPEGAFYENQLEHAKSGADLRETMRLFCDYLAKVSTLEKPEQLEYFNSFPPKTKDEIACIGGTGSRLDEMHARLDTVEETKAILHTGTVLSSQMVEGLKQGVDFGSHVHLPPYLEYCFGVKRSDDIKVHDPHYLSPQYAVPAAVLWDALRTHGDRFKERLGKEAEEEIKDRKEDLDKACRGITEEKSPEELSDLLILISQSEIGGKYKVGLAKFLKTEDVGEEEQYSLDWEKIAGYVPELPMAPLLGGRSSSLTAELKGHVNALDATCLFSQRSVPHIHALLRSKEPDAVLVGIEALWALGEVHAGSSPLLFASLVKDIGIGFIEECAALLPERQRFKVGRIKDRFDHYIDRPEVRQYLQSRSDLSLGELLKFNAPFEDIIAALKDSRKSGVGSLREGSARNLALHPSVIEILGEIKRTNIPLPDVFLGQLVFTASRYNNLVLLEYLSHTFEIGKPAIVNFIDVDGITPAHIAARQGHAGVIKALHTAGADFGIRDAEGKTAAHWAAMEGHADVIAALHAAGADFGIRDAEGKTAAHRAAIEGHADVIAALHAVGADLNIKDTQGFVAAHLAAVEGHADVIAALHAAGADLNAKDGTGNTSAHWAASNGRVSVIKALHTARADLNAKNGTGNTPAHWAASNGHGYVIAELHAAGADLNAKDGANRTAADWAASHGHASVIAALREARADLNAKDGTGNTSAHWAASNGHAPVIAALHAAGADLNAKDGTGRTAAHWAAFNGHASIIAALHAAGADLNAKDGTGRTAAHGAASNRRVSVIAALHAAGADLNIRDAGGLTAADLALSNSKTDALRALVKQGGIISHFCSKQYRIWRTQFPESSAILDEYQEYREGAKVLMKRMAERTGNVFSYKRDKAAFIDDIYVSLKQCCNAGTVRLDSVRSNPDQAIAALIEQQKTGKNGDFYKGVSHLLGIGCAQDPIAAAGCFCAALSNPSVDGACKEKCREILQRNGQGDLLLLYVIKEIKEKLRPPRELLEAEQRRVAVKLNAVRLDVIGTTSIRQGFVSAQVRALESPRTLGMSEVASGEGRRPRGAKVSPMNDPTTSLSNLGVVRTLPEQGTSRA